LCHFCYCPILRACPAVRLELQAGDKTYCGLPSQHRREKPCRMDGNSRCPCVCIYPYEVVVFCEFWSFYRQSRYRTPCNGAVTLASYCEKTCCALRIHHRLGTPYRMSGSSRGPCFCRYRYADEISCEP
jgi:hypothetical protein